MRSLLTGILVLGVMAGICAVAFGPGYVFYTGAGSTRNSKEYATKRTENNAKTQYDLATMDLEQQRLRGTISDEQYRRGLTHENAMLDFRTNIATHPEKLGCNFGDDGNNQTHIWHIPSVCETSLQFTVWHEEQGKKTVRAKLYDEDGEPLEPKFVALRGSSCTDLNNGQWEFDGNCQFAYAATGKRQTLRVTVE